MDNIILLTTWKAPAGSEYLKRLADIDNINLAVVYEENPKLQGEITRIYQERFGDSAPKFEPPQSFLGSRKIPSYFVPNSNAEECLKIVKELEPNLLVLGGTGIVKAPLLAIPTLGTLNCHPGILPRYRGCTCVEWAIYEDQPVGATVHFVTEEIDAGDIVLKETMPVYHGDSYQDVRLRMFYFQAELMAQAVVEMVHSGSNVLKNVEKFNKNESRYHKPIPPEKLQNIVEKLSQGRYRYELARRVIEKRTVT